MDEDDVSWGHESGDCGDPGLLRSPASNAAPVMLQPPPDQVARLPALMRTTQMDHSTSPSATGGLGCVSGLAVSGARPIPDSRPSEGQLACAAMLQRLAREILQAVQDFEARQLHLLASSILAATADQPMSPSSSDHQYLQTTTTSS